MRQKAEGEGEKSFKLSPLYRRPASVVCPLRRFPKQVLCRRFRAGLAGRQHRHTGGTGLPLHSTGRRGT